MEICIQEINLGKSDMQSSSCTTVKGPDSSKMIRPEIADNISMLARYLILLNAGQ